MKRASGVLMHVSSLYGDYSIGSFGKEAKEWIDRLAEGGFTYWQVLPFCMTDDCNSPYKSFSAFGGNPFFIDLPTLHGKGLITSAELESAKQNAPWLCEYARLSEERLPLLRLAASRVEEPGREEIRAFMTKHEDLAQAAEFLALREKNHGLPWQEWTDETADGEELFFWQFVQHEFFLQWSEIKAYANRRGIRVIGDVPIYVAQDSADVWANREQFLLDERYNPTHVAGVPPDYFAEDGQLWGNPLYNWKRMKEDGYAWWKRRIRHMLTLFDGVRIDHFRGFEAYWSVPASAKTAKEGKWVKGPGRSLINAIREVAGDRLIIAEDLGDITPGVEALLRYSRLPGMRVLQFAFLGDEASPHLPHNYPENCVAYTGTHDNNTLLGYIWELDEEARTRVLTYCNCEGREWSHACTGLIKAMLASHAATVLFPVQDLLVYGADTRMNTPGTSDRNWAYRVTREQLDTLDLSKLRALNRLYGRL